MDLFPQATKPTKKLLALFLIGQLCTEHFTSVRNLHKTFLSSVCDKKLNSYYHALSNYKIANTQIRQILAKMSLSIIPESLSCDTKEFIRDTRHHQGIASNETYQSTPRASQGKPEHTQRITLRHTRA